MQNSISSQATPPGSWKGILQKWKGILQKWKGILQKWKGILQKWKGILVRQPLAVANVGVVVVKAKPSALRIGDFKSDRATLEELLNARCDHPFLVELIDGFEEESADLPIHPDHPNSATLEDLGEKEGRLFSVEIFGSFCTMVLVLAIGCMYTDRTEIVIGLSFLVVGEVDIAAVGVGAFGVSRSPTGVRGVTAILHAHVTEPETGCAGVHTLDSRRRIFDGESSIPT